MLAQTFSPGFCYKIYAKAMLGIGLTVPVLNSSKLGNTHMPSFLLSSGLFADLLSVVSLLYTIIY